MSELKNTHPLYNTYINEWRKMRDVYAGAPAVKAKTVQYLPPTPSMVIDGMDSPKKRGYQNYESYISRAVFFEYVQEGVESLMGNMHRKPPIIELPPKLQPLMERATNHGESLYQLLRRINENQLVTGRLGLLGDFPESVAPGEMPLPFIALYSAESITNWDEGAASKDAIASLNLVVLDESGFYRENFTWKECEQYRVLMLGELTANEESGVGNVYTQHLFSNISGTLTFTQSEMLPPVYRAEACNEIPFVIVNSKDITSSPDKPPLISLGNLALAIYHGDADYRQNLFMQGQDTFVTIGSSFGGSDSLSDDDGVRVGAGAHLQMELNGDAKYVGVNSQGLPEQRTSLENDKKLAETIAGRLVDSRAAGVESGEALKTRIAAQTATLTSIALTGAIGLQSILRILAKWMGDDPLKVVVTPNLDFGAAYPVAKDILDLINARAMGSPISLESIHAFAMDRGLVKFDFETELDKIDQENAERGLNKGNGGLDDPAKKPPAEE